MPAFRPARRRALALAGGAVAVALLTTACSSRDEGSAQAAAARSAPAATTAVGRPVPSSPAVAPAAVGAPSATPASSAPAAPRPPAPCAKNTAAQLVLVKVKAQHVWMCEHHTLVFSSPVTTGAVDLPYDSTPTGTFRVQEKDRDRVLTLLGGQQYTVKYWIPFDAPLFGFHDSPWQKMPYGSPRYTTKGSHGCVHMPLPAMRFLYRWAEVGAKVRVKP